MGKFVQYDKIKTSFLSHLSSIEEPAAQYVTNHLQDIENLFDTSVSDNIESQLKQLLITIHDLKEYPRIGAVAFMFSFAHNYFVVRLYDELKDSFIASPTKSIEDCADIHQITSDFGELIRIPFDSLDTQIDFYEDEYEDIDISDIMYELKELAEAKIYNTLEQSLHSTLQNTTLSPERFCNTVLIYIDQHDGGTSDLIASVQSGTITG